MQAQIYNLTHQFPIMHTLKRTSFSIIYESKTAQGEPCIIKFAAKENSEAFSALFCEASLMSQLSGSISHLLRPIEHGLGCLNKHQEGYILILPRLTSSIESLHIQSKQAFLDYTLQILQPIHQLHQQGWVHGDLKANNVLFDSHSSQLFICDLGLTKREHSLINGTSQSFYTSAQETLFAKRAAHSSYDMFCIGVILFGLLTDQKILSKQNLLFQQCQERDPKKPQRALQQAINQPTQSHLSTFSNLPNWLSKQELQHMIDALLNLEFSLEHSTLIAHKIKQCFNQPEARPSCEALVRLFESIAQPTTMIHPPKTQKKLQAALYSSIFALAAFGVSWWMGA